MTDQAIVDRAIKVIEDTHTALAVLSEVGFDGKPLFARFERLTMAGTAVALEMGLERLYALQSVETDAKGHVGTGNGDLAQARGCQGVSPSGQGGVDAG